MAKADEISQSESFTTILQQPRIPAPELKRVFRYFIKKYHPDRGIDARLREEYRKKIADKRNAETFFRALASFDAKDDDIDLWKDLKQQGEGRRVLFPTRGNVDTSIIVTVHSPRELLMLLTAYDEGTWDDGVITESERAAMAGAAEARKIIDPEPEEDYSEQALDLLQSCRENAATLEEYINWREEHKDNDEFPTEVLSYPIRTDKGPSTLRASLNNFALELIENESQSVDIDSFDDFRDRVKRCGFFLTAKMPVPLSMDAEQITKIMKEYIEPTRAIANRIVKKTLLRVFENAIDQASPRDALAVVTSKVSDYGFSEESYPIYLTRADIAALNARARSRKKGLPEA